MTYKKINDLKLHNNSLHEEISSAITRVVDSGWFVLGPEVEAFEQEFAEFCSSSHCISVANGTDALELALRGLGICRGDEVITVANAGMYSSTAILAIGAIPVFVDVEVDSHNIDPKQIEVLINDNTRVIIATHLYGRMADMPGLRELADDHGLKLLEDCAQAHGAELFGKVAGSWGDAAAFSFYPTKNIGALGDGGAIVVNDAALDQKMRALRQYGWGQKYSVTVLGGRNSRLDEIQAAIIRVKLKYAQKWNQRRREIAALYNQYIEHENISTPLFSGKEYVAHLYVLSCSDRDSLMQHLRNCSIACEVHYPLLDYQQSTLEAEYSDYHLPVSENMCRQIVTLPCYPEMSDDDVLYVARKVNQWIL